MARSRSRTPCPDLWYAVPLLAQGILGRQDSNPGSRWTGAEQRSPGPSDTSRRQRERRSSVAAGADLVVIDCPCLSVSDESRIGYARASSTGPGEDEPGRAGELHHAGLCPVRGAASARRLVHRCRDPRTRLRPVICGRQHNRMWWRAFGGRDVRRIGADRTNNIRLPNRADRSDAPAHPISGEVRSRGRRLGGGRALTRRMPPPGKTTTSGFLKTRPGAGNYYCAACRHCPAMRFRLFVLLPGVYSRLGPVCCRRA